MDDDLDRFEARCRPVVEMRRGEDGTWRGPPESAALLGDRGAVAARTPAELAGLVLRCWCSGVDLLFLGNGPGGGDVAAGSIDPSVWDAINEYVAACGGDTGNATVGNRRMDAVVGVERAIAKQAGPGGGVKGGAGAHAGAGPRRPDPPIGETMKIPRICKTCGKKFEVMPHKLKEGRGVYCSTACAKGTRFAPTHGQTDSRLYSIWEGMKARCLKPKHQRFSYYGGRGIRICDEWLDSFVKFRDWALANGYSSGLSLDRVDPDGNYSPENCRWATHQQQMWNTKKRKGNLTSSFKGVCWSSSGKKWLAQINHPVNGKVSIGFFAEEVEAAHAYDAVAAELFGEFAVLNFPKRPDQSEVCDSGFDDAAAAELCKEIAEEHRRGP